MRKIDVSSAHDALSYITDCTLATVESRCMTKSATKSETQRQISIAQSAIDWMRAFGVDFSGTRAEEVVSKFGGNVAYWSTKFKK